MIKVTINKETKYIHTADELTVNQFINLSKHKDANLVTYLSTVLDITYKASFDLKIKGSDTLKKRIGIVEDYQKMSPKNKIIIDDDYRFIKDLEISTIGERWMIEENGKNLKNEELLCFILAVGLVKDKTDFEKVRQMTDKLMKQPYKEILPSAFFLLNRFLHGSGNGRNYLARLMFSIRITILKKWQVLKILGNTLIILKYKLYASF